MTLYDVKAGDKVLEWNYGSHTVREVARVTKTQVVLGAEYPRKYRKSDGYEVGEKYSRSNIRPITAEEIVEREQRLEEEAQLNVLRREAADLVAGIQVRYLTKEQAEELICFIKNEWGQGV